MYEQNIELLKVSDHVKEVINAFWNVIKLRKVPRFYFESDKGNVGDRDIKPYMIYINAKGEIKVAGVPRELWNIPPSEQKNARHYLLNKINLNKIQNLK